MMKYMLSASLLLVSSAFASSTECKYSNFPAETGCKVLGKEAVTRILLQFAPNAQITVKGLNLLNQSDIVQVATAAATTVAKNREKALSVEVLTKVAKESASAFAREKVVQAALAGRDALSEKTGIKKPEFIKKDAKLSYVFDLIQENVIRYGAALLVANASAKAKPYLPKFESKTKTE